MRPKEIESSWKMEKERMKWKNPATRKIRESFLNLDFVYNGE